MDDLAELESVVKQLREGLIADHEAASKLIDLATELYADCPCEQCAKERTCRKS